MMRISWYQVLILLAVLVVTGPNLIAAAPVNALNATNVSSQGRIPQVEFLYIPIYMTAQPNQSVVSQLTLKNTGTFTAYVNLSIGGLNNIFVLSTNSISLPAGQTTSISLLLKSNLTSTPGGYYVPLNVHVSSGNYSSYQTKYITVVIQNRIAGQPYVSSQIVLTNNTNIASGTIQISSPKNKSIQNLTLKTTIITPDSSTINASQIITYGLDNNVTIENNSYVITWYIRNIPAGKSVYAYYTITKPANELSLNQINVIFSQPHMQ